MKRGSKVRIVGGPSVGMVGTIKRMNGTSAEIALHGPYETAVRGPDGVVYRVQTRALRQAALRYVKIGLLESQGAER